MSVDLGGGRSVLVVCWVLAGGIKRGEIMTKAEIDVIGERGRQRVKWKPEHDDDHKNGELSSVASSLAHPKTHFTEPCGCREAFCPHTGFVVDWTPPAPGWVAKLFLENDRRERLVISAALILAEIERMDRLSGAV